MRNKYLGMRQIYSKAVRRVKRSYQRRMQDKLEQELKCPKKFWKSVKKMNVGQRKKGCVIWKFMTKMATLTQVKTWREHFAKVLGTSNEGAVGD